MSTTQTLTVVDAGFTQEQIDIIKSQVAPKGTTNEELALFLMYCQRTGLDPFARQIYLSERRSKNQQTGQWDVTRKPETTVDGFRISAERNGHYAGQLGPFWCGEDGEWKDVWTSREPPVAAKVGILRHDFKEPLWAVALYDEYVQVKADGKPNSMWSKMPANQLAKCAESLGHRRAFPRELSGLYTREEMPTEQHEAKEAQRDYLAEKGLEPYVAPKKLPPATKPEVIRELSETLDQPPSTIEQRETAKRAEAEEVLNEIVKDATKPAKRKKGGVSFKALGAIGEVKDLLRKDSGDDTAYYGILKSFGYDKSNEIKDDDEARNIYKTLATRHKQITSEKDLLDTLTHASEVIGVRALTDLLGVHGCEIMADVLKLEGDPLAALLAEVKARVDERKGSA